MTADDVNAYCGLPYQLGACGPDKYDCRGLMVHIQRKYFSHNVPDLPNGEEMRDMYEQRLKSGIWELVDCPQDGDGAILRGGDHPHVGVYLEIDSMNKGVIHSIDGIGVMWTPKNHFRAQGFSRIQYIRFFEGPAQ